MKLSDKAREMVVEMEKWIPEHESVIDLVNECAEALDTKDKKIGDLQRLCEKSLLCLSEHWDEMTDKDGYGYTSLESALKKAASGKEYKELRLFSDKLIKINQGLEKELQKYKRQASDARLMLDSKQLKMLDEPHPNNCSCYFCNPII